jgi:alpha-glucosidase
MRYTPNVADCASMKLSIVVLSLIAPAAASAQTWAVESPDGRTVVTLERHDGGHLTWRITRDRESVLEASPLGIRRDDQSFADGLVVIDAAALREIDERYTMPHGKRRDHRVRAREQTVTFANATGARVDVIVRAHDAGAAMRYRFASGSGRRTVVEELTGFKVPAGATGWLMPQQAVDKYGPAYEEFFEEVASGANAPRPDGWAFPALFKTREGKWLLLHESGLDGEYCGSHLAIAPGDVYTIRFPDQKEGLGVGERLPSSMLPWTTPWRVVIVGDRAGDILESDLVNDLSPPSRLTETSWIRPGRASWSWWSASNSPRHAAQLNAFIDMGAEMGWEYALVDANWNFMETGRIEDVIAHAKQKGVGLFFWYNSGGPHNDVTEAPRDRMHTRDARRAEFAKLREWGVKGVKVDFWHSDKQDRIRQYRDILADAIDFQLMVNFHGSTVPRGWQREFPHLVSMEAVFGAEQYKFREEFATRAASHNTILPFTRNAIGSMDYTPVTFSDAKFPHTTTNAHELAQAVVFESGVQHFADSTSSYRGLPDAPKAFLEAVPAAWDETRAIAGEPGQFVVVARRNAREWYVGGLNGLETPRHVTVPLALLGSGKWTASIVRDGDADRTFAGETRSVTAKDTIAIDMRGRGGFVVRLVPATGGTR